MFKRYAKIPPEAIPDLYSICKSGEHGVELCQAIVSELRTVDREDDPYYGIYATCSITQKQIENFIPDSVKDKHRTIGRAIKSALKDGALVRQLRGFKGTASVYTLKCFIPENQTKPNQTNSNQIKSNQLKPNQTLGDTGECDNVPKSAGKRGHLTPYMGTNDGLSRDTGECDNVPYPYSPITNPDLLIGATKKPSEQEWIEFCRGTVDLDLFKAREEYERLERIGWKDARGNHINNWRSYASKLNPYAPCNEPATNANTQSKNTLMGRKNQNDLKKTPDFLRKHEYPP